MSDEQGSTPSTKPTVTKLKRFLQVFFAVLSCLVSAGVIYGYAALKPALVRQGVYSNLCTPEEKDEKVWICVEQDLRMNYMFTLAFTATNVAALPIGALLDNAGPRWTISLGSIIFALGNFAFGLQYESEFLDTYFIGYVLLAIGGPCVFLSSFHLANAFPESSGLILSCLTGAFDAGSVPYLLFNIADQKFGGIPIRIFFWGYIIFPVLILIEQLTIAPAYSYKRDDFSTQVTKHLPIDDNSDSLQPVGEEPIQGTKGEFRVDPVVGMMFGESATRQIKSTWFLAITVFLCVYGARINFYIQTVHSQLLQYLSNPATAETLTTVFTVLLPLGGVFSIPFIGYLLDYRTSFDTCLVLLFAGLTCTVLNLLPSVVAQVISMVVLVVMRPLMYTYVGDYFSKIFGFVTFGTVYGLANTISGFAGLVLRPIDVLVKGPLGGNNTPVNFMWMIVGLVVAGTLAWKIHKGTRSLQLH